MYQLPRTLFDRLPSTGVERGICISNFPSTSKASAIKPLGLFAFDSCIITNTAGQAQLMGKPADTPAAVIANAVKQSIATSTTTTEVQANSGAIANNFDKDAVQSEIDLQVKVTQQFDTTRQQAKTIVNQHIDGLNKDIKALEDAKTAGTITADQDKLLTEKLAERDNWQIGGTIVDSIASGLSGPSSTGAAGILANAAAPQLQYQIGQYFKGTDAEGSTAHILAHTILAAAVAAAGGNDGLMAGLAAGGAEAVAPAVANWLYGSNPDVKKDADGKVIASQLTAEQKNTLSNIIGLGTAGATGLAGGSVTDVVSSTGLAQTAVEDNRLLYQSEYDRAKKLSQNKTALDKLSSIEGRIITQEEFEGRILAETLKNSDSLIASENPTHDYNIRSVIGCNNLNCSGLQGEVDGYYNNTQNLGVAKNNFNSTSLADRYLNNGLTDAQYRQKNITYERTGKVAIAATACVLGGLSACKYGAQGAATAAGFNFALSKPVTTTDIVVGAYTGNLGKYYESKLVEWSGGINNVVVKTTAKTPGFPAGQVAKGVVGDTNSFDPIFDPKTNPYWGLKNIKDKVFAPSLTPLFPDLKKGK